MKKTIQKAFCLLISLMFALQADAAVIRDSIKSEVLGVQRYFMVYLPAGFQRETDRHYPVLYLLHGFTDDERSWLDKGQMDRVADELMASGEAKQMVIVMPCAGGPDTKNVWNGYFNMPGWNYEDHFFQELLPAVEKKYRAGGSREQRAVAGLSMGGGGSVGYALGHPDMFCACYPMSAWLNAQARADAPLDDKVAQVTNAVAKRNPFDKLDNASEAELNTLRQIKFFIDCGDDDFLFDNNIELYKKLRMKRFDAQLRVRDGGHSWEYWHNALRLCLPFVSRNFSNH
ncbi:MAG: esterase family protein [Bacteroidaceae bacterium]|nr:esterase family protein [Bacteroidaceae bacterium]